MTPVLAISAWSGTGKTTLLKKLIPALCARGIRPGLIKHTHHNMDVDNRAKIAMSCVKRVRHKRWWQALSAGH
jgi:molybdopterin-guanine dinucleotide biosynthesis protein MobB